MKIVTVTVDLNDPKSFPRGYVDKAKLDATTEEDIARHEAEDFAEARRDAGRHLQRVRKRLGLSQRELAKRIHVSTETIRNWEQGKRRPTGPARALLRILDKAPEAALEALKEPEFQHPFGLLKAD